MDLDLNQSPSSESGLITELSPWLNELETAHERIEERIRQLEAIVSRIRQRTTPQQPTIVQPSIDTTAGVIHERARERLSDNNQTYLIAKALNMEKPTSIPGGYFDCNICVKKAEDPILTCCGHLFCWGCFYQLPLIYLNIKECPVCDGEVTDTEVIPIYGNGDDDDCDIATKKKTKLEDCGLCLPPRPNAKRIESVRQKIINRTVPFIPVIHETTTMEHFRRTIDSIGLQALAQGEEFGLSNIITSGAARPLRSPAPHLVPFSGFPSLEPLVVPPAFDDVDTTSLRRNRRRSARIADGNRSQNISFRIDTPIPSPPRMSVVPVSLPNVNASGVVTSAASSSRGRRRDDVNNGPTRRSRRRRRLG